MTSTLTQVGERVRVCGLVAAAKYNGRVGRVGGYDHSEGRYRVTLEAATSTRRKKSKPKVMLVLALTPTLALNPQW